jgi:hypothetical protein
MHRCPVCEQPFVSHEPTEQTCKGYLSPPGHDHDDNRVVRCYRCGAGHVTSVALRRRCGALGCAWRNRGTVATSTGHSSTQPSPCPQGQWPCPHRCVVAAPSLGDRIRRA